MRTEEKVFFGIGTASFLLMLSDLLLEVFSASLFIGSKRLISYIGILIIVCAVSFTVLCFLVVKNHRGRFKSKGARIFLRVLSIIICFLTILYRSNGMVLSFSSQAARKEKERIRIRESTFFILSRTD